jgi:omega-hydroxy-beta-dihydromenaquinone-9 sulfotransferase
MWHCTTTSVALKFFKKRPPLKWRKAGRIATIPGFAVYNSVMAATENLIYGRQIERTQIHPQPLFVIGHWRSGTTLLHNLVCADKQFTFCNMYQVAFPRHFLLTENIVAPLTDPFIPKTRPMDNMATGWKLPQEDEIALCAMHLLSPYLMIGVPDRPAYVPYLELDDVSPEELQVWKDAFIYFMKKLTIRENKPIVLKSPTHTFRVRLLQEMFPDAKFLYIYRNPFNVFKSSMHLRVAMFEENTLGMVDYDAFEDDVLYLYDRFFKAYERDRLNVPEGNLHEVRYEDLEQDPLGELEKAYDGLGLSGFDELKQTLEPEIPKLKRYKKNQYSSLDPVTKQRIYSRLRPAIERYGYSAEGADGLPVETREAEVA